MVALDHTLLISLGLSLASFRVPEPWGGPLDRQHERFWIPVSELPEALQKLSPGRVRRAALVNSVTMPGFVLGSGCHATLQDLKRMFPSCVQLRKDTRLEVTWSADRPILFEVLDQGSVGWSSKAVPRTTIRQESIYLLWRVLVT
eukprot:s2141_g9.t1